MNRIETKIMVKDVKILPEMLGVNIKYSLLNIIKKKYLHSSTSDTGCILRVYDEISILDSFINNTTSDIFYRVEYTVDVYKPEIGDMFDNAVVHAIYNEGIFLFVADIEHKIFIPFSDNLESLGFVFSERTNTFIKDNSTICLQSKLDTQINAVQFKDGMFRCIGCIR